MDEGSRTVWCKSEARVAYVPHAVIMLEETASENRKLIHRVDKGLAYGRITSERPYAELAAGNGQIEYLSLLRSEREVDHGGKRSKFGAGNSVCSSFPIKWLNLRRDKSVDCLITCISIRYWLLTSGSYFGVSLGHDDVARAAVKDKGA